MVDSDIANSKDQWILQDTVHTDGKSGLQLAPLAWLPNDQLFTLTHPLTPSVGGSGLIPRGMTPPTLRPDFMQISYAPAARGSLGLAVWSN